MEINTQLTVGAATADITPKGSVFLFGYPGVKRISTGVHDRLTSTALFLSDGKTSLMMIANDVIFISKATASRVRRRLEEETGIPAAHIIVTATHTHSGPMTADMLSNEYDTAVPRTDPSYVGRLEEGILEAASGALQNARPAQLGLVVANGSCVGTNRHDPAGPADPEVPVLVARDPYYETYIAALVLCNMHPTVLHEDSTLVSGDFPAITRRYLQSHVFGEQCPIVYHTGPSGNQSPRHVTQANTFAEAERLGGLLGQAIREAMASMRFASQVELGCATASVELPLRAMPSVDQAEQSVRQAAERLDRLRQSGAVRTEIRTAECDWFGAEENLALARAAAAARLTAAVASVMPAEIVAIRIGPWRFVAWPGEIYVEFALQVKATCKDCYLISLANGELQGYLVTKEAVQQAYYEANNALFASPESGDRLVHVTLDLIKNL